MVAPSLRYGHLIPKHILTATSTSLCLSLLVAAVVADASMIRVDQTGAGDALTVAEGMLLATGGDTVAVRHGLHAVSNLRVVDGVQLLGGWNDTFTARDPGTSLLQGGPGQVLRCTVGQGPETLIDGFEITGADDSAILCTAASPTITTNIFHDNDGVDGGAIHCEYGASPLIEGNHIHHNTAVLGGGIRAHLGQDTSPIIRHNLVEHNHATYAGGGIAVGNSSSLIEDNIIQFNSTGPGASYTGGGIHVWHAGGGVVEIRRNLIVLNSAVEGGGIGITGGHPIVESNTVWGNAAMLGGALFQEESTIPDPGTTQVFANILGGSTHGVGVHCEPDDPAMVLDCNCVYGNAGGSYSGCNAGPSDFSQDPQFCAPTSDFHLSSSSPCAPPGVTGCGLVGALPVGCGPISVEPESWGRIKAHYGGDRK